MFNLKLDFMKKRKKVKVHDPINFGHEPFIQLNKVQSLPNDDTQPVQKVQERKQDSKEDHK